MINNYDHLMDSARPSHMGSKNSEPHLAGGDAGYSVAMGGKGNSYGAKEQDPGGSTPGKVGKSKKGSMMDSQHGKERGAPGGMEMLLVASLSAAFEMAKHSKSKSKVVGQNLVGPGYPNMGAVMPNHMGSQSQSPTKEDNYLDTNMDVPPIDRGAYGPGY